MGGIVVPLLAAALMFTAVIVAALFIVGWKNSAAKNRSLALVQGYASRHEDVHDVVVAAAATESLTSYSLLAFGNKLVGTSGRERLARQLMYAGDTSPGSVDATVSRKVIYLIVGFALGLLLGISSGGLYWVLVPGLTVLGFFIPDLLVYNRGIKRDEELGLGMPDALDLLNLCVESGLSFQAALSQVASGQTGPVAEEFAFVLQEMQYGRSRGDALGAMATRTRQPDIQRFVSAMLQVDKLGVPVAAVLREQAKEMRAKRYARAREQAQKVPVKILMPLMLCFLPALFIIILGPAAFQIAEAFSGT